MHGMYAGKERRNRTVALVLTVVLVAGVVLALLATVLQAGPARALPAHASLVSIAPADALPISASLIASWQACARCSCARAG